MSQLLRCMCGGQFVIAPQAQTTACHCPHCGQLCYIPAAAPAAVVPQQPPPAVPPAPPPVTPPPQAISPSVPAGPPTLVTAARSSPKNQETWLWLVGLGAAAFLILLVVLNFPAKRELANKTPRKKQPAATNSRPTLLPQPDPSTPQNSPPVAKETPRPTEAEVPPPATQPVPNEPASNPVAMSPAEPSSPTNISEVAFSQPLPERLTTLVKTHCISCHNATEQEAGLRMDDLITRPLLASSSQRWEQVLFRMQSEEMPPPDASTLSKDDRAFAVTWLNAELVRLAEQTPRPSVRRLNRAEYMNTMQTLIGLPPDPTLIIDDVISSGFDTDATELTLSPQLMGQYVYLARAAAAELRRRSAKPQETKFKLFGEADALQAADEVAAEARRRLQPFASTAFRRPVTEDKLERLIQIVVDKTAAGKSFDDGMQLAVQTVLCSPQFLLLTDLNDVNDDYALASKLSYFLWSSPPDAPLLALAEARTLRTSETLREQVTRMLKDPRSRALADNFSGQWLGTRELGLMQPDEEIFPDYSPLVEASMREETHRFFDHILRQNLSIVNFIDADFTFVNEPLARLYGIPGVRGIEFRKVSLNPQQHRGGVLTQATMLSITSDGVRSSPVIRGVWVLENILGSPPAPPPADVPDLESDTRGTKSIREELAKHRQIESCNSCHRKIDPLGFALENYDAIGQWRTHYRAEKPANSVPVDNQGELPDGTKMVGVVPLKKALLQRKREFARCLTEKLLAYSCSRKLDLRDRETVETIVEATAAGDYRFQTLIQALVHSYPFRGS